MARTAVLSLSMMLAGTLRPTRGAAQEDFVPETLLPTLAGALGSWVVGIPVFLFLERHAGGRRFKGDAGYSRSANMGLLLSSALGAGGAVHLARRSSTQDSSLRGAVAGAGLATLPFALGYDDPRLPYYVLTIGTALQAFGARVGSGMGREPDETMYTGSQPDIMRLQRWPTRRQPVWVGRAWQL